MQPLCSQVTLPQNLSAGQEVCYNKNNTVADRGSPASAFRQLIPRAVKGPTYTLCEYRLIVYNREDAIIDH